MESEQVIRHRLPADVLHNCTRISYQKYCEW